MYFVSRLGADWLLTFTLQKCWRANLQQQLRDNGVSNFQFVGSLSGSCAGNNIQQNHEGHSGSQATDYATYGNLTGWLNQNPPDVIIMLLGTNDVLLGNKPNKDILAAYDVLIGQMRTKNPKIQIVFSNLLPLDPARFPAAAVSGIKSLNSAIASYALSKSTAQSGVYPVDNYSGFDPVKDTTDGEHPNDSGNQKIATKFLWITKTAMHAVSRQPGHWKMNRRMTIADRRRAAV